MQKNFSFKEKMKNFLFAVANQICSYFVLKKEREEVDCAPSVSIESVRAEKWHVPSRGKNFFAKMQLFCFWKFSEKETNFLFTKKKESLFIIFAGTVFLGSMIYFFWQNKFDTGAPSVAAVTVEKQVMLREDAGEDDAISHREIFSEKLREMVKGYPIEDMVPYIANQDRRVAAYLVAIAKKESNWGRRIPVYYGENCFNYWGYRGQNEIMGSAGHTCFDTPKEAVAIVSARLESLVIDRGLSRAKDLILWKCGSSCSNHDAYDVLKWISDVELYYREVFRAAEV